MNDKSNNKNNNSKKWWYKDRCSCVLCLLPREVNDAKNKETEKKNERHKMVNLKCKRIYGIKTEKREREKKSHDKYEWNERIANDGIPYRNLSDVTDDYFFFILIFSSERVISWTDCFPYYLSVCPRVPFVHRRRPSCRFIKTYSNANDVDAISK